ncbi:MFS transporter [Amycolatopsis echigonensis]|uniref:Putative proline/betaine transporter n=2 Tax=Amycolatopsis echigonensis TaxID=2576905 RepID=A0A2N3X265_9PSEU|nr:MULTISPECIES: MFS transporter [Amycolatopsis]PKW00212.1 MHS family proline/betaine transporter-like MFS transporter [Amycolatopsis niigatensis]
MTAAPEGPGGTVGAIAIEDEKTIRRASMAAAVGNVAEWYDFGIYSYLAAIALDRVFFPEAGSWAPVLTLATFAAAFLVRPLGGFILGPLGDRIGRTRVLSATVLLMAGATLLLGLVPSYGTIGIAAPLIVLFIRMLQGFSAGGEYAGALTLVAEYAPDRRRGFFGSWLEFGTLVGYTLGAGISALLITVLPQDDLLAWGWRIPFMIALPVGAVGIYLRLRLEETPAFRQLMRRSPAMATMSLRRMFRVLLTKHRSEAWIAGGLVIAWNVTNYVLTNYVPTYLTGTLPSHGVTGTSESVSSTLQVIVMIAMLAVILFVGKLSDRIGRKPILLTGSLLLVVAGLPSVWLLRHGLAGQVAGLFIMGFTLLCFAAVTPSTLPALFPTFIRYGSLSIIFNIFVSAFAGTAPTVIGVAVTGTGNLDWPGYYLIGAGVIGLLATLSLKEPAGRALPGSAPLASTSELLTPDQATGGVPVEDPSAR